LCLFHFPVETCSHCPEHGTAKGARLLCAGNLDRHAQHIGHPVAGDDKYGDPDANRRLRERTGLRRLFLHAASLEFALDGGRAEYVLNAPLAAELVEVLDRLA
jgi:hypothetical protein